jgi:hypothetical protein
VSNRRVRPHDKVIWKHPRYANPAGWMDVISPNLDQRDTTNGPRQQHNEKTEQIDPLTCNTYQAVRPKPFDFAFDSYAHLFTIIYGATAA